MRYILEKSYCTGLFSSTDMWQIVCLDYNHSPHFLYISMSLYFLYRTCYVSCRQTRFGDQSFVSLPVGLRKFSLSCFHTPCNMLTNSHFQDWLIVVYTMGSKADNKPLNILSHYSSSMLLNSRKAHSSRCTSCHCWRKNLYGKARGSLLKCDHMFRCRLYILPLSSFIIIHEVVGDQNQWQNTFISHDFCKVHDDDAYHVIILWSTWNKQSCWHLHEHMVSYMGHKRKHSTSCVH